MRALFVLLLLGLVSTAATAAEHPFEEKQLAVRAGVRGVLDGASSTGDAEVTVSYWGRGGLSGEVSAGRGFGSDVDRGLWLTGMLRYGLVFGESGAHAVGLGAGVSRWTQSSFGPALFARGEAFYEHRSREGFDVIVGFGPSVSLTRTSAPPAESTVFARTPYTAGEVGWSLTAALGWAF